MDRRDKPGSMNAVDAFSAQMRQMGYSQAGGPTPTPPTWPNGTPAVPGAPPPAAPGQTGQAQGYWYALPAGNPERLTVAQVIQKVYKLDPQRDANQLSQIATYVAQQNGIMLANWPIPSNVTGLRLPWAPPEAEKKEKKKNSVNFAQVIAGIGVVAAGAARIAGRHSGQGSTLPPGTYGYPYNGQPTSGNRDVDMISADIADAVPIIAQIGAIFSGQPAPGTVPPYYGQTYTPNTPGYQPPVYQPPVYQPPVYQPPVYQPPVYQPPVYQPPQPYNPPYYQPPTYQPPQPYNPPGYPYQQPGTYAPGTYMPNGGDPWGNQVNQIVNGVGQLANSLGQLFGKKR